MGAPKTLKIVPPEVPGNPLTVQINDGTGDYLQGVESVHLQGSKATIVVSPVDSDLPSPPVTSA